MTLQMPQKPVENNPLDDFKKEIDSEVEQTSRALKEIKLMLDQSQTEMGKLTQRNAAITAHLQQVQAQFETMPRPDIRNAYTMALDAQQRLLVMRSQLDKLQTDQDALARYQAFLEKARSVMAQGVVSGGKGGHGSDSGASMLEMIVKAQEAERQRLSRQMHDGPAQALSNFIVQAEIANRLIDTDVSRAKEELDNLKNAAMNTFKEVRTFIFELRPMMLDDLGLAPTIRRYLDNFKEQTSIDINFTVKGSERRIEPILEVMIFRALQELVGNAYRHNQDLPNKLQVNVQMVMDDMSTKIVVSDNGKGFDPNSIGKKEGVGLKVIRERAELLGGSLEVDSDLGKGARVTFQIPTLEQPSSAS